MSKFMYVGLGLIRYTTLIWRKQHLVGMNDVAMRIPRDSGSAKSCRGLINLNYC